ncbi:hypothetical protein VUG52_16575 [Pseudomonas sp. LH21]|uniref:hypothetical protein n=1 Tax=Pseudomonas sp. LH21 TaxID=3114884 RepID=UPI002F92642E
MSYLRKDVGSHKHLIKTSLFWWALLLPVLSGAILAGLIGWGSDLGQACISSRCVQNFVGHFKFPITIAGLSLPLVAMPAAIHRSMEAALQIDLASKQYGEAIKNNRFGNYLKHRESFEKVLDGFIAKHNVGGSTNVGLSTYRLYARLFPGSGYGRIQWAGEFDEVFWGKIEDSCKVMHTQMGQAEDGFNADKFIYAVSYLIGELEVDYVDFITIEYTSSASRPVRLHAPNKDDDFEAIAFAAFDLGEIIIAIRGFLGINEFDDLLGGYTIDAVSNALRAYRDRLEVTRYDQDDD